MGREARQDSIYCDCITYLTGVIGSLCELAIPQTDPSPCPSPSMMIQLAMRNPRSSEYKGPKSHPTAKFHKKLYDHWDLFI